MSKREEDDTAMFWKVCLAFISITMMSACSLNPAAPQAVMELTPASLDATKTKEPSPTPLPTYTPTPDWQPTPTAQPLSAGNVASSNSQGCTITRTDLPIYTVVSGDTLSNIARRTNSTVAELTQINCLPDASQISVGQQLYVPQAAASNSTTNNTNTSNGVTIIDNQDNTIDVSPYVSNEIRNGTGHWIVRAKTTVTLTWTTMPTDMGIGQVEFFYVDDHYTASHTAIGLDTNVADGASITWNVPDGITGRIYAGARLPGQNHEAVQSADITIESLPYLIGPRGALSADPNIQAGTPDDWGDYIVAPGETITITWSGIDPPEYENVRTVEFQYEPDSGGIQILGKDTDKSDGISVVWIVPDNVSGRIKATGGYGSNNESGIFSPDIHVRTPNTSVTPCEFQPFGIGGDVPVYGIPNLSTDPIQTINMESTYPVLGKGYQTDNEDNGLFYHLDFGNHSGWVRAIRGELVGDCDLD